MSEWAGMKVDGDESYDTQGRQRIMMGWDNIYAVMGKKRKTILRKELGGVWERRGDIWFYFLFLFLGAAK